MGTGSVIGKKSLAQAGSPINPSSPSAMPVREYSELARIINAMEEEYSNGTQIIAQLWELLRPITTPSPCAPSSEEKSAGASTELNTTLLTRLEYMRDINTRMASLRDSLNLL